jgi:hypothetical protein
VSKRLHRCCVRADADGENQHSEERKRRSTDQLPPRIGEIAAQLIQITKAARRASLLFAGFDTAEINPGAAARLLR